MKNAKHYNFADDTEALYVLSVGQKFAKTTYALFKNIIQEKSLRSSTSHWYVYLAGMFAHIVIVFTAM